MVLREAFPEEYPYLYKLGYQEWPKGRTLDRYIKDNQQEELYGTRYVLADSSGRVFASLMMMRLRSYLFGIGSVVVHPDFRGRGIGTHLLVECMSLVEKKHPDTAFMLYSEIGTAYYTRIGFQPLPEACQRFTQGICMVRASQPLYKRICRIPAPDYF